MCTKHYDKAFKENTVKLSYQLESLSALSREIGVSVGRLSKWRKEFLEYGSPRLSMELKKKNIPLSRSTTAKYMSELGLKSKLLRKFKRTTDSDYNLTAAGFL